MKTVRMIAIATTVLMMSEAGLYAQPSKPPEIELGMAAPARTFDRRHEDRMMPPPFSPCGRMNDPKDMLGCFSGMPDSDSMRRAGATEQQIGILEEFMFEQCMKCIDLRAAAEKAEMTMERLLKTTDPDEKAVMQAADALNQARGQVFKESVMCRIKVKQVLGDKLMHKLIEQRPPAGPEQCRDERGLEHPAQDKEGRK